VEQGAAVHQALASVMRPASAPTATGQQPASLTAQDAALGLQIAGRAPDFTGISHWFNTPRPLTLAGLRGKVVLVDFWTYSCINCLRTLPHLKDWYARYHRDGFYIVGVHSPEFAFEGIASNVAAAIRQWGIPYPVALDPQYGTWTAYNNQYWPAEYVIDAQGDIVYTSFGEGEYAHTERVIRQLLADAGHGVSVKAGTVPDLTPTYPTTAETYVGSERTSGFSSPQQLVPGTAQDFTTPQTLYAGQYALSGRWRVEPQEATALRAGDSLDFTLTADKVFVIFAPAKGTARVRVLLDGRPVDDRKNAGADVRHGIVRVDMDNLYSVVDLHGPIQTHRLRLIFDTPGMQVYSFTFG
jgi:thiol-disulfide isomerase/thioredoxin